jgi:hypothetical protein
MLSALPRTFLLPFSVASLPLFILLALSPISAQTPVTPGTFEQLPPVPTTSGGYVVNGANNNTTNSPSYDFQAPNYNQNNQNNQVIQQNNERYLVIVNSNSPQVLQQVRQVEPTAYFRTVSGGAVIQAGTFTRMTNVQNRLRELANYRIADVRVFNAVNGQEIRYASGGTGGNNPNNPNPSVSQRRYDYYYVAIPGNPNELITIENKIRSNIGQVVGVNRRSEPRGTHIAVGPFSQRLQAEQWNNYLQNMGFDNARVYYGK